MEDPEIVVGEVIEGNVQEKLIPSPLGEIVRDENGRYQRVGKTAEEKARSQKKYAAQLKGKMLKLANGEISVEEMDDQELARMQFRDVDGFFRGRPPAHIPRELVMAINGELARRLESELRSGLMPALSVVREIMSDPDVKPGDRLAAAKSWIERAAGPVPKEVKLTSSADVEETGFGAALKGLSRRRASRTEVTRPDGTTERTETYEES